MFSHYNLIMWQCFYVFLIFFCLFIAGGLLRCLQVAVLLLNLMGSSCATVLSVRKKKIAGRKNQENRILFKGYLLIEKMSR